MFVKVHHEAPEIGVQITTQDTEDGRHFSDWVEDNHYFVDEDDDDDEDDDYYDEDDDYYDDEDDDDYDDEDCRYPLNVALNRVAKAYTQGCLDVRKFHFLFYFRHQLCYCLEFSDTKTPILHELNRKQTAKIEISTLKLVSYHC